MQGNRVTALGGTVVYASPSQEVLERRLKRGIYRLEPDGLYKRCSRCRDYWPADSEFFSVARCEPDALNVWCKACYVEWRYPSGRGRRLSVFDTEDLYAA